ncbi:MAG: hypothetical protein ACI379_16605 [Nocardioides sp.]|uniref:hypothetical protein n=1 Tax=Nocardioides sp. TaxID=35761 RepID=UPI003F038A42
MSGRASSTLFTVGTLLRRAQDQGVSVRALVEGQWVDGVPVAADSMGVILDAPDGQTLIRTEAITAVRFQRGALEDPVPTEAHHEEQIVWAQPAGSSQLLETTAIEG